MTTPLSLLINAEKRPDGLWDVHLEVVSPANPARDAARTDLVLAGQLQLLEAGATLENCLLTTEDGVTTARADFVMPQNDALWNLLDTTLLTFGRSVRQGQL